MVHVGGEVRDVGLLHPDLDGAGQEPVDAVVDDLVDRRDVGGDHRLAEAEEATIRELLNEKFDLTGDAAETLLHEARSVAEDSVSMHDFTRAIHEGMDYDEKQRVIEMLWRVALADRNLDKYEDYLIGKLGELLYVSRGDVIRLRHKVADQAG